MTDTGTRVGQRRVVCTQLSLLSPLRPALPSFRAGVQCWALVFSRTSHWETQAAGWEAVCATEVLIEVISGDESNLMHSRVSGEAVKALI